MSSAAGYTTVCDVLAQEQTVVYPAIRRQPASEKERSGIELRTAEKKATACEREGAERNRAAHCGEKGDSLRARRLHPPNR